MTSGVSGIVLSRSSATLPLMPCSQTNRMLARITLGILCYGHWERGHLQHHAKVGTWEDPSTARMGETFYAFAIRNVRGNLGERPVATSTQPTVLRGAVRATWAPSHSRRLRACSGGLEFRSPSASHGGPATVAPHQHVFPMGGRVSRPCRRSMGPVRRCRAPRLRHAGLRGHLRVAAGRLHRALRPGAFHGSCDGRSPHPGLRSRLLECGLDCHQLRPLRPAAALPPPRAGQQASGRLRWGAGLTSGAITWHKSRLQR